MAVRSAVTADLDGDCAAEVLRTTWTIDGDRVRPVVAVLRGADGRQRYTIEP